VAHGAGHTLVFGDPRLNAGKITFHSHGSQPMRVSAELDDLEARVDTTQLRHGPKADGLVVDVPAGAFKGRISIADHGISCHGHLDGVRAKLPELELPLAGRNARIEGGELRASGDFSIDTDGRVSLSNAAAKLALAGGAIELPQGGRLEIQPGTEAAVELAALSHAPGDAFATLRGKLDFAASLRTDVAGRGLDLGKNAQLRALGDNAEQVQVSVGQVAVERDGSFALDDIEVAAAAQAEGVWAHLGEKKRRYGLVLLKPR
jgi:hypothetical protein